MVKTKTTQQEPGSKPVTLADIGREAGVSFSIVSRVLRNRKDRIPEVTRKKVLEAAERLGYRRNLLIQGVQTGRSMNIGVIVPPTGSFYSEIVRGIHDEFRRNEYCIVLAWNPENTAVPDSEIERELIHGLLDRRVDGIILRPTHSDVSDIYFSEVQERNIPMVTVDRPLPGVKCDFSGTDDEHGARLATRHLLEAGHRNLVHLAVDNPFAPGSLRQKGFEAECAEVPDAESRTVTFAYDDDHTLAESVAEELLSSSDRPTALFLASDYLAPGVFRAARKLGLRIPEDVSIMGFGNLERGEFAVPSLSSINQNPYQMGENAARMILHRIQGDGGRISSELVEPSLIERESVSQV